MKSFLPITLLAGLLACSPALAQSGVPSLMSYQAIVTDDNGDPLAPSAPVSYEITMRIYDAATAGNLLWSEKQLTDVFQGRFAIILGDGQEVPVAGGQFEVRPDLGTVFSQSERFTEITVRENVTGAASKTLTPRQRLVATATAFRAKVAETLGTGTTTALAVADSGNVGIGTTTPGYKLEVNGNFAAGNSILGALYATGGIQAAGNSTVHSQGTHIEWNRTSGGGETYILNQKGFGGGGIVFGEVDSGNNVTERMRISGNGNVGIGTPNPEVALDVNGVIRANNSTVAAPSNGIHGGPGQRLILWPGSAVDTPFGFGIAGATLWSAVPTGTLHAWYEGTTERMRINSGGNVGIGMTSPGQKLDVAGNIRANGGNASIVVGDSTGTNRAVLGVAAGAGAFSSSAAANDAVLRAESGGKLLLQSGAGDAAIAIASNNNVGIGTVAPTQAKLVVNGSTNARPHTANYGYLATTGASGLSASVAQNNSIYTTNTIWAGEFVISSSDERIKTIQGRSDGKADLETLLGVEITDYHYKDIVGKGDASQKKVIAQQVEEVFPQAVSQQTDVVPDIYKVATIQDGWVTLVTDFKVGERVKLIADETEGIHEVLEIAEGKFRTDFKPEGEKVFVYGREVNDFRTVDYDALAMLNVSATQELHRRLEAKEKEVEALKSRLNAIDEKMVAILALLSADKGETIKPVLLTSETASN